MDEFLAASLSFPTVVFTVLLLISLVYWLLVIIGALGLDMLDADHGGDAGHVDLHHGDVGHGDVGHGDVGHADAHAHADAHGHADADGHAHGHNGEGLGALPTLLWVLKLNAVPMTIVLSLVFFWSWLACHLGTHFVIGYGAHWGIELAWLTGAVVLALPLTSLSVRPIAPLFRSRPAARKAALVGQIVMVDTSRVDGRFGNARAEDGGAGLIVEIRCEAANSLTRGDRALVVSYDDARDVYEVTPIDDIIPSDKPARRE
jgi:hypothetical protein